MSSLKNLYIEQNQSLKTVLQSEDLLTSIFKIVPSLDLFRNLMLVNKLFQTCAQKIDFHWAMQYKVKFCSSSKEYLQDKFVEINLFDSYDDSAYYISNTIGTFLESYESEKFEPHYFNPWVVYFIFQSRNWPFDMWDVNDLPRSAVPFSKNKIWCENLNKCFSRLYQRLVSGRGLNPHCTGEEFVLRQIFEKSEFLNWYDVEDKKVSKIFGEIPKYLIWDFEKYSEEPSDPWCDYLNFILIDCYLLKDVDLDWLYQYENDFDKHALSQVVQNQARTINLHPCEWFIKFPDFYCRG